MEFVDVVGAGQLLAFGSANLIVTVLALRHARRSVELADTRLEALRAEQARIVALLREERRTWRREMGEERSRHLSLSEARRRTSEHAHRSQSSAREENRLEEELQSAHEARDQERRARLDTERRIARLEAEVRRLRETTERRKVPVAAGMSQTTTETPRPLPPKPAETAPGPRGLYETAGSAEPVKRQRAVSGRVVWHPHPDAGSGGAAGTGAPVEMFRKHYDKYLENYAGYVELIEGIRRTRQAGEKPRSPFGEQELQDRLRRLEDGIARTTSRLDLLEQYNPQLATDDRISRRADIAARHARISRP